MSGDAFAKWGIRVEGFVEANVDCRVAVAGAVDLSVESCECVYGIDGEVFDDGGTEDGGREAGEEIFCKLGLEVGWSTGGGSIDDESMDGTVSNRGWSFKPAVLSSSAGVSAFPAFSSSGAKAANLCRMRSCFAASSFAASSSLRARFLSIRSRISLCCSTRGSTGGSV